jgi:hypothetical protein
MASGQRAQREQVLHVEQADRPAGAVDHGQLVDLALAQQPPRLATSWSGATLTGRAVMTSSIGRASMSKRLLARAARRFRRRSPSV